MEKSSNDWLYLGIFLLVIGIILAIYSVATYTELKSLSEKVDFELIDDNNSLSSSEKYYKYLAIADYLTQKINNNKNLPIKNSSCVYLDYAQHNAIELYTLTDTRLEADDFKQKSAMSNIRGLRTLLDSYNTCQKSALYKAELDKIITDNENKTQETLEFSRHDYSEPSVPQDVEPYLENNYEQGDTSEEKEIRE